MPIPEIVERLRLLSARSEIVECLLHSAHCVGFPQCVPGICVSSITASSAFTDDFHPQMKCLQHSSMVVVIIVYFIPGILPFQIENMVGGEDLYRERVRGFLVPAIADFTAATRNDSLWKMLNYQLMLKTRHSDKEVGGHACC